MTMVGAIAAIIADVLVLGSNLGTSKQAAAAMKDTKIKSRAN